jgi:adenosine kinase
MENRMSKGVMISGSVAYDTIMVFDGQFKDHILPEQTHMINVAFLTPRLKREFGGCAANIAYNLQALGGSPVILAAVGRDGADYVERLRGYGIDCSRIVRLDEHYTAQAFITTDLADNQITAFHPGAMSFADQASANAQSGTVAWGIVAPNGRDAMIAHAAAFARQGIPFIFDPGQGLPMFDGEALRSFVGQARAVVVNDYESHMLCERTGWSEAAIAERVESLIVTRGGEGSVLHHRGEMAVIGPAAVTKTVDPTGCGDAYRAGLLFGLTSGWDWLASARLGSVMGAVKIEHAGAQNHPIDREAIARRYLQAYGNRPWG